jgi:hypothetical protein
VARWLTDSHSDVPERVRKYKPKLHGQGEAGIRQWRGEAISWLLEHPDRTLPCGDRLAVLRTTCRLLEDEWGIR